MQIKLKEKAESVLGKKLRNLRVRLMMKGEAREQ